MAAIADFTVYDGASTPVLHTMKAISISRVGNALVALYREDTGSLSNEAQVRMTQTMEKLRSANTKVEERWVVPVMETISNQNSAGYTAMPKVAYEDTFILSMYAHPRSTKVGRRLVRQLGINHAQDVTTSVVPATAGSFPVLFDSLIMPS